MAETRLRGPGRNKLGKGIRKMMTATELERELKKLDEQRDDVLVNLTWQLAAVCKDYECRLKTAEQTIGQLKWDLIQRQSGG